MQKVMENIEIYPKFTVIIPQKNREEYIGATIKTCMIQDYPNFEIIVSDDCSEDNSVEIINSLATQDSRIKLFAHKKHLGMRDNFEFALSKVSKGYVIALGGDDGLTPGCIWRMYEILQETNTSLLTWTPAVFCYPTPSSDGHSILLVKRKRNRGIKILRSDDFLKRISKTFRYQIDECPMFYMKGVVSTEIIDRVRSRTPDGKFYYCPTPDGFSGVVLAGEVSEYAFTYEPLSIGGTTPKSQGQNYRRSDTQSRKEAEQFFADNARKTMHSELASQPYSPLVTLMTADYLLTAKDLPGWPGKCYKVSFENLIKQTFKLIANSYFEKEVLSRELAILYNIAKQHQLTDLFENLYNNTVRKIKSSKDVYGFVISNSLRFDGSELGIKDIFDACLPVNFIYNFYNLTNYKFILNTLKNQIELIRHLKSIDKEPVKQIHFTR